MNIDELIKKSQDLSSTATKHELVNSMILPFIFIFIATFIILRILSYLFGWFNKKKDEDYLFDRQKFILAALVYGGIACGGYFVYEKKLKVRKET